MKEAINSLINQVIALPGRALGVLESLLDSLKGMAAGPGSILKIIGVLVAVDLIMLSKLGITAEVIKLGTQVMGIAAGNVTALIVLVLAYIVLKK